ncbi:MAG: redoxin domain-containing protein [Proteobacteria bacterium]|nr:redoxin domain-containing protein [Pseudomonadota bacterium]
MRLLLALIALVTFSANAHAAAYAVGDAIPATVKVTLADGTTHSLQEYRGHPLVLEWTNYGCPFTRKHYDSGNMQKLQSTYTAQGVTWLSVMSSAPGKQGYYSQADAPSAIAHMGFKGTGVVLDPEGTLGRAFGAETTPDMYVIDASGKLAYRGAIDSIPSFSKEDIAKADNYVADALDEVLAGKEVTTPQTNPYGCSVKY